MADPISILGTVVGIASLAIQTTQILREYCQNVSSFHSDMEELLTQTLQLSDVLQKLEDFLRNDRTKLSISFTTTSTLYSASIRCEIRLHSLIHTLKKYSKGPRAREIVRALQWPFKASETSKLLTDIRGFIQTFQLSLSIDGCQLLLKTSDEVSRILRNTLHTESLAKQNNQDLVSVINLVSALPQTTLAINRGVEQLEARAKADDDERALEWLTESNTAAKHQAVTRNRLANAGQWIFDDPSYKKWKNGIQPVLLCYGKPGAGKSILMSYVIDRLNDEAGLEDGVAFFYCEYSQAVESQTPEIIVASFVGQLATRLPSIPHELRDLYSWHKKRGTKPTLPELIILFQQIRSRFANVWLLIDALDELDPDSNDMLMNIIETLAASARILVTSRLQSVDSKTLEDQTISCIVSAQSQDVGAVVRDRLGKAAIASRRLREHPKWDGFVEEAVRKLDEKANGMFILVSFQLEMLLRPRTVFEMREALEKIPQKLPDFYSLTLDRIRARESDLALKTLAWLVKHLRPMSAGELSEALAVEHSSSTISSEALIHQDEIVEMCCGLVTMQPDGALSFAHATVYEYLATNLEVVANFDTQIAKTCLEYLNFASFSTPTDDSHVEFPSIPHIEYPSIPSSYERRVRAHPFLPYAGRYWFDHYKRAHEPEELLDLVLKLLLSPNVAAMLQAFSDNKYIRFVDFTPLHTTALLGSMTLIKLLLAEVDKEARKRTTDSMARHTFFQDVVDSTAAFGNTPLLYAVFHKHWSVAKLLLETRAVDPSIQDNTVVRWALDSDQQYLLPLMVDLPGFNVKLARRQFGSRIEGYLNMSHTSQQPR